MNAPDVVGSAEAAQILGVEIQRISRWRDSGKMPLPTDELAATPLWRYEDVQELAENDAPAWTGPRPAPTNLIGLAEAASTIGVDKSQIGRWRRNNPGKLPEPKLDRRAPGTPWERGAGLSATPLWDRKDIETFAKRRAQGAA